MQKKIILLSTVVLLSLPLFAQEDYTTDVSKLPAKAKEFLEQHFPNNKVSYILTDKEFLYTEYEVKLNFGQEIKFNKDGDWKEMEAKKALFLPNSAIPDIILEYINTSYPEMKIKKIEKEYWGYDVELQNGFELKLNKKGKLIDIDD